MSDSNISLEESSSLDGSPEVLTWEYHGDIVCELKDHIRLLQEEKKSLQETVEKLQDENRLLRGNKQSIFRPMYNFFTLRLCKRIFSN